MTKKRNIPISIFISFVAVVSALLVEANVLFYWAIVDIFTITNIDYRFIIGVILAIMSSGFIVMLIIEKYSTGIFVRFFYTITSIWTGMFVYFFMAAAIYDVLNLFMKNPQIIGFPLFAAALVIGIYGLIHGRKIAVKKINVAIPGMPENWKGRTAVWMSDLHLGSVRGEQFAEKVMQISNSLSPDVVFIGGDLYDGTRAPNPVVIAEPLEKLSTRFGVFYISGNHEEFGDAEQFFDAVKLLRIKILDDEMINIEGLQIIGVDYSNNAKKENFKKNLESIIFDRSKASILLKHEPKDLDIAAGERISFQISGHTHDGQQWPFNYLTDLITKGYSYGLKNYGLMQIYISSGTGGWGPPIRVGSDCEIVHITFI